MEEETISWVGLEHEHKEKSSDWYWALGVIVVAGSIASIVLKNYFFVIILVLGGAMMGYLSSRPPREIAYEFNENGFKTGDVLFPYKNMSHFWVREGENPMLFIKIEKSFTPMISIQIENQYAKSIRKMLLSKNIEEKETHEHVADKILDFLGY